jgi:hypothetical protein
MNQSAIFGPFLTVMLLTLVVWFYMYAKRIPLIQKSQIDPNKLTAAELARISPPSVSNPSDNLKNLFELPTLTYVIAAWTFAAFRVLHSAVHCTVNIVMLRFWLYCISALALWFMVIRAACSALWP